MRASGVNTVPVYATVTDSRGTLVPDLSAQDFEVEDNGGRQSITVFSRDTQAMTIAILLDVFAAKSSDRGVTWIGESKLTDVRSNGNWEQFDDRSVPFAGDYVWVSSIGVEKRAEAGGIPDGSVASWTAMLMAGNTDAWTLSVSG